MRTITYIHGAGASPRSFAWLQERLPEHRATFVTYSVSDTMSTVVERVLDLVTSCGERQILVGHSMGGLIAAACSHHTLVSRVATLSAPFGGLHMAGLASLFSSAPMLRDLARYSAGMIRLRAEGVGCPALSVVGTAGLPFIREPNDGAVTVASQRALPGPRYVETPLNHFEVLLDQAVADLIRDFILEPDAHADAAVDAAGTSGR